MTADGLRVLGVSSFDEGEYTCRAEVEADGRYDERRIHVEVHGKLNTKAPFTRYKLLSNRFDNCLYRVYKYSTGCQSRLTAV